MSLDVPGAGRELVGHAATRIARLAGLGLRTPPGFVLTTDAWRGYAGDGTIPPTTWSCVVEQLAARAARLPRAGTIVVVVRGSGPIPVPHLRTADRSIELDADAVAWLAERAASDAAGTPPDVAAPPAAHALYAAVIAVWDVWSAAPATRVRRRAELPDELGIAVTMQLLPRGTNEPWSGTGVAFSRDPISGSVRAEGTFRTGDGPPMPLAAMRALQPDALLEIDGALSLIEADLCDLCEVEFAVVRGVPWFLRARPGRRSATAAIRVAVELVDAGLIGVDEALDRIPLSVVDRLQRGDAPDHELARQVGHDAPAVPAPDVEIAQLLQWADERRRVEIVAEPRADAATVSRPEHVPGRVTTPVDVAVDPDDHCGAQLERTVLTLVAAGATDLGLVGLPGAGFDHVRPPSAPWRVVIADRNRWSTRLLAGRIDVRSDG